MISNKYIILIACIGSFLTASFIITFAKNSTPFRQNDTSVNLIIKLNNIESGTITVSQLSNVNTVSAEIINGIDGSAINYTVTSFTFSVQFANGPKDISIFTEKTTGNLLTPKMKKKLSELKPGCIITIKDIIATSPQNMNVSYGITNWQVVADPTIIQK